MINSFTKNGIDYRKISENTWANTMTPCSVWGLGYGQCTKIIHGTTRQDVIDAFEWETGNTPPECHEVTRELDARYEESLRLARLEQDS